MKQRVGLGLEEQDQMFNEIDSSALLKRVYASRIEGWESSDVVLDTLLADHDFGQDFFHKILHKGLLKPHPVNKQVS